MSSALAGWLQAGLLIAALAACYVPLGNYMAHIFTTDKDWKIERFLYRLIGIDSKADQKWSVYVRSILAFSAVSVIFLYGFQRLQHYLPYSEHMPAVPTDTAWNTAVSFVTNTNWQNYAGEATMSYLTQQGALMVQQFFSAAVGLAVAIAMIRGFTRSRTDRLGNFWVDVTRGVIRLLLPLALVFMFLISLLFTSIGTAIGSVLQDMQGFPLVMNFLVMPLFFFSDALFPITGLPKALMLALRLNPLTYGVDGLRGTLGHAFAFSLITDFAVLVIASSILLSIGSYLFSKIQL